MPRDIPSSEEAVEALQGVLKYIRYSKEYTDELERRLTFLTAKPQTPSEAPAASRSRSRQGKTSAQAARQIKPLDIHNTRNGAKVVEVLLREEVRQVGKMTSSLQAVLGVQPSAAQRLVRTLLDALPFLTREVELLRVRPGCYDEAARWLESARNVNGKRERIHSGNCSDHALALFGPRIVKALLSSPGEVYTNALYEVVGTNRNMLLRVLQRMSSEGFFEYESTGLGKPGLVRLTDRERASVWLRETSPDIPAQSPQSTLMAN